MKQWSRWLSKEGVPQWDMFFRTHRVALGWLFDRINLDPKNPNQVHRHQKPTCWHVNQGKFHTWRMESSFVFIPTSAISVLQFVLKGWQKGYNKIQDKSESQQNRDHWWVLLQGLPRICHPRRQKARGRAAMEARVHEVRKLRERTERGNPLWAATQKPCRTYISNNLLKALSQHATLSGMITKLGLLKSVNWQTDGW